jgi:hypothetical protein
MFPCDDELRVGEAHLPSGCHLDAVCAHPGHGRGLAGAT